MSSLLLLKSMLYANAIQKSKKKKKVNLKKASTKTTGLDLRMCRICNDKEGEIPIFNNIVQPNIPEEIENFSGIILNNSEQLPHQMCPRCLDLLNGCILFREMCQKSYRQQIELTVKKESSTYDDEHEIKQDVEAYDPPSPVLSDNLEIWKCTTCSTDFDNWKFYKKHMKDCSKEHDIKPSRANSENNKTQFLCDTCGKTCKSKANLSVHMGTHENIFPFKCEECPYQGRTMDLLKVHKRTHLADKPFKCTQCPKSTTTASNLAKHMRHVHSTSRPFKCSYCDRAFSYQHDMKRHMKDIHLRTSTVECDVCFKKFNTKKILQGHRWKVHKIKGERSGRLPSYLQCQRDAPPDAGADEGEGEGEAAAAPAQPHNTDLNYLLIFKPNEATAS